MGKTVVSKIDDITGYVLVTELADELEIPRYSFYSMIRRNSVQAVSYRGRLLVHHDEADRLRAEHKSLARRPRTTKTDPTKETTP